MDGLARRELLKEAALGVALMPVVTAGMAAAAAEREEAKGMMKEMAGEIRRRTQSILRNPTAYEAPRH